MDTSPASLTRRSIRSARTRSIARVAAAGSGSAPCAGAPGFGCSAAFGAAGAARGAAGVASGIVVARRGGRRGGRLRGRYGARPSDFGRSARRGLRVHQPVVEECHAVERDSSPSNRVDGSASEPSAFSTRVSIECVSSPSAIAPHIRAEPLSVCSTRSRAWPAAALSGARAPVAQRLADGRDEFLRFLEEDRQQLRVDVVVDAARAALDRDLLDLDLGDRQAALSRLHREGDDVARRGSARDGA